ncbi:MAG: thermosome subunit beta [Candidatus Woesearchaeota archaeon]
MQGTPIQPIFIVADNTQRTKGKEALYNNIQAAKVIGETLKTTLGPKGMDKMLINSLGEIVVTNDGATILSEMELEHPAAKMMAEIAKTQEKEVGDGTTTAVVLAAELLSKAEKMIEENIHPTLIAKGYLMASEKAIEILEKIAKPIEITEKEVFVKISETAMTGKVAEEEKEKLARIVTEAVHYVLQNGEVSMDDISIVKKEGGAVRDTELIKGIVIDKDRVHPEMPKLVKDARIALIDSPIEVKETEIDAKIQINDPNQIQAFIEQEAEIIKKLVDKIIKTNANVVFCQKGIDDLAQYLLAKKGIYAVRRVKKSDLERLAKATGGKIVTNIEEISEKDLGFAETVKQVKVGDEDFTFVEGCKNPKAVSILVRGGTEHVVDEVKRAIEDAIGDCITLIKSRKIVGGAGATEIELSKELEKYANSLSGRLQIIVKNFAEALEVIPKALAENAGLDSIDVITKLKAAHQKGELFAGLNVDDGSTLDTLKEMIIEPLQLKKQAIKSAVEVAIMILRIDDIIASGKKEEKDKKNQQAQTEENE